MSLNVASAHQLKTNSPAHGRRNEVQAIGLNCCHSKRAVYVQIHECKFSIVQDRHLTPKYAIRDLDIWTQCYFRWLPVLEIKNGGNPQIDLFNRWILSSISKLQQALQSRDFDDLPERTKQQPPTATCDGELISSFFPFTRNTTESNDLADLLNASADLLAEGSIFDGLSVTQE